MKSLISRSWPSSNVQHSTTWEHLRTGVPIFIGSLTECQATDEASRQNPIYTALFFPHNKEISNYTTAETFPLFSANWARAQTSFPAYQICCTPGDCCSTDGLSLDCETLGLKLSLWNICLFKRAAAVVGLEGCQHKENTVAVEQRERSRAWSRAEQDLKDFGHGTKQRTELTSTLRLKLVLNFSASASKIWLSKRWLRVCRQTPPLPQSNGNCNQPIFVIVKFQNQVSAKNC